MNRLTLNDFALFVHIATAQSLSTVARGNNIPVSRVSRALSHIEAECGLRLVRRTTHGLSLTDDGQVFLEYAKRFVSERNLLQDSLSVRAKSAKGTVRVSVAQLLAEHVLIPKLGAFGELCPDLDLDLHIADSVADIAQDGIDIVIRAGISPAETLIARSLGKHGRVLYAAPGYLKKHGMPRRPGDLNTHSLITNTASPTHNQWHFLIDGKQTVQTMRGRFRVNNSAAVVSLALAGTGIARINDVLGRDLVHQGKLKPVLADYCIPGEYSIYAAILAERHRAPKIRVVMDYLKICFAAFSRPARTST